MDAATTNGRLIKRDASPLPVLVQPASQLSLHVEVPGGIAPAFGSVFDQLELDGPNGVLALSRCRFEPDPTPRGGRLVFLDETYDCNVLLKENRLLSLGSLFDKLPLVLAQKLEVRPAFRIYVSDLIYDLNVWRKFFNEQDRIISHEPPDVARVAQQQLLEVRGPAFYQFFDAQVVQLDTLVKDFSREEHERHGYYFRQQMWSFIIGAEFMKRTNLKPRGYAGDSEMMQMVYDNAFVGRYVFNKLMHRHPLTVPAAQAVRNRRALVPQLLRAARARLGKNEPREVRVMSLACGPARELAEIFAGEPDSDRLDLTLFDQDPEALETAQQTVEEIEKGRNQKLKVRYVPDSVRTVLRSRNLKDHLGGFHFIYSMGLFDYLTPPVAKAVLHRMYSLLEPGGSIAVGNYHVRNPNRNYMAYWLDWSLYYRTDEELLALADGLEGAQTTLGFDASGCQMFLTVTRA